MDSPRNILIFKLLFSAILGLSPRDIRFEEYLVSGRNLDLVEYLLGYTFFFFNMMTLHSLKCHGYFVAYSLAKYLNPWQPCACDKAEAFTLRHPMAVKGLTLSLPSAPGPSQLELGLIRGALFMCFGSVSGSLIAEISWLLVPIWRVPCCFLST